MKTVRSHRGNKNVLIVVAALLALGSLLVFSQFDISDRLQAWIKQNRESRVFREASYQTLNTLEPTEVSKALPDLENILRSPSSPEREAQAKILLAFTAFSGESPDAVRGVALLQEVAINEGYPRLQRAIAVQYLAERADDYGETFAREHVFTGQPFESFYRDGDLSIAVRKLNEWADELYPITVPNYRIAHWYAERLTRDKFSPYLSAEEREQYRAILNQRLERANALFATVPMDQWNQDRLMFSYLLRARTLGKLYVLNPHEPTRIEAEKYFALTREVAERHFLPHGIGLVGLFHYASFLVESSPQPDAGKISSILEPILSIPKDGKSAFFGFLERERNATHNRHYHKREILLLTKTAPRFRDLLLELGWDETELRTTVKPVAS